MKVLNLYAGIGGNRKLWEDCEVTAIEYDRATAEVYQDYFPNDKVIVADAHQYLLDHYKEFDFIWSSPPCPTHSKFNHMKRVAMDNYPDMKLYQEIIFLHHRFKGKYVIENVVPFYTPLIPAKEIARHLFWSNFKIRLFDKGKIKGNPIKKWNVKTWEDYYGYDLSKYEMDSNKKRKALRNMVDPELGNHIYQAAKGIYQRQNKEQGVLGL